MENYLLKVTKLAFTMLLVVRAVNSEPFVTSVQPAASAAAQARAGLYAGKFHAVITPTTPIGCQIVIMRLSFLFAGIVLP